jgi:hypothetical protein
MIAALITALCVIAVGATVWLRGWLARRDEARDVEAKVADAVKVEAADVAKADAVLTTERAKDPIDLVNERFGSGPKSR